MPDYAASKHQPRHATKATIVPAYVTRRSALHYPCAELYKSLTRKCSLNLTHRFLQHPFSTQHTARHYARKQNGAWRSCVPGQTKITLHISLGVESCTFHWQWNPAHFTGSGILHISLGVESCTFHWEWNPAHFTGSGVLHISLGVGLAWVEDVLVLCEVAFGVRGVISVNTNITQE